MSVPPERPLAHRSRAKVLWEKRLVPGLDDLNATAREWRLRRKVPTFGKAYAEELAAQIKFAWAA